MVELSSKAKKEQEGYEEPFQGESLGGFATCGLVLADLKGEGRKEPVSSSRGRRQPRREDRWGSRCCTCRAVTQQSRAAIRP